MNNKNIFNYYEIIGVATPGAIIIFGFSFLYPDYFDLLKAKDISFGGLGLFIILAYVIGQLSQAVGNIVEWIWWKLWGGMPTDWIRTKENMLLSREQRETLLTNLSKKLKLNKPTDLSKISSREWYGITRQIYAAVSAHSRAGRIDIFNATYGLNRGIATALIILFMLEIFLNPGNWRTLLITAILAGLFLSRMHRFAKHYARELFVQFLQLSEN